ncbi:MAG: hypothetical protein ABIP53_00940, partial [Candidatus Limnocylindrales bacterium]
ALGLPHAWFIREDFSSHPGFDTYPDPETTLRSIAIWSDAVFVPSHYMRETYSRLLGRDDIRVVYPTFDGRLLEHAKLSRTRDGKWQVIVCASISPHKNQLELLSAAALLRASRGEFVVTVMGPANDPRYLQTLREFVDENDSGFDRRVSRGRGGPRADDGATRHLRRAICQ